MKLLIVASLYVLTLAVFIWARLWYFQYQKKATTLTAILYDSVVGIHMAGTLIELWNSSDLSLFQFTLAMVLLSSSLGLFYWSIKSSRVSNLAFEMDVNSLYTHGAYSFVRHPFYLSYSLTWFVGFSLFDFWLLSITLLYLLGFYFLSAIREEKSMLDSDYSEEYRRYRNDVGMFFPRIRKWISLNSKKSTEIPKSRRLQKK